MELVDHRAVVALTDGAAREGAIGASGQGLAIAVLNQQPMPFYVSHIQAQAHLHQPANIVVIGFGKAIELQPGQVEAGILVGIDVVDDGIEGRLAGKFQQLGDSYFITVRFFDELILPKYRYGLPKTGREQIGTPEA